MKYTLTERVKHLAKARTEVEIAEHQLGKSKRSLLSVTLPKFSGLAKELALAKAFGVK